MGLTDRRRAIVIFGDSLTQRSFEPTSGWGSALAHMYGRRCDVYNRGYGGYNTRWCRSMLPHLFPLDGTEHPLLVTVMLGTNDAALPDAVPTAVVPLDEYADNLTAIVRHLKSTARHVVVMTPPCMDEPGRLRFQVEAHGANATGKLDRTNENTQLYAERAKEVAATCEVPCVDLFALTLRESGDGGVVDGLFIDGIHFNAKGQGIVFEGLRRCLLTMPAGALDPEAMDPDWPFGPQLRAAAPEAWRDIFAAHERGMSIAPTLHGRRRGGRGGRGGRSSTGLLLLDVAMAALVVVGCVHFSVRALGFSKR